MLFSKILYEGVSEYATLKVLQNRGTISLISGGKFVQSSYRPGQRPLGTVWDYFLVAPLFAPNPDEVKEVCILGLGAGVAVKLLNSVYKIERIVGVEIDEVVVDLGRRFFDLNDSNLEVRLQDAAEYVKESSRKFDLILIDTFKDDEVDSGCSCLEFYSNAVKLLKPGGIVLVNRAKTKEQEKTNKDFRREFPRLFSQGYGLAVKNNIFYLGLQKPLEKREIIERIKGLAAKREFTRFLQGFNERDLHQISLAF